jgi:hypothetical protein
MFLPSVCVVLLALVVVIVPSLSSGAMVEETFLDLSVCQSGSILDGFSTLVGTTLLSN